MKKIATAMVRYLFGHFYAVIGAFGTYYLITGQANEWPAYNEAEKALVSALIDAKFFAPTVSLTCLSGGLAMLFHRTAPIGLLLLTPLIVVIFLYHAFLTGAYVHAGAQVLFLALLYWIYRDAFIPLWNYGRKTAA